MRKRLVVSALISAVFLAQAAFAEEAKKIQDNSFLLEEAYNQEKGVVQHINAFQYIKDKGWTYTFTQEWPVPDEKHQLSYTIPVLGTEGERGTTGIGDVLLNYRYQAVGNKNLAVAPRVSLILPTGDRERGLGTGTVGYQINLPVSYDINKQWVAHFNAGATYIPGGKDEAGEKQDQFGHNVGASAIWQPSQKVNFMLEVAWNGNRVLPEGTGASWDNTFYVNPGVRFAIDFPCGLQIVPGVAVPVGIGPSSGDYGVFGYLSFEHPLF